MNIFKFWHSRDVDVNLNGKKFLKTFYFGSNNSLEDAKKKCQDHINEKIFNFEKLFITKERALKFKEYDSDIIEEVLHDISNNNISAFITRNKYGAEILCVDKMMILDIDNNMNFSYALNFPKHTFWDAILSKFFIYTQKYKEIELQIKNILSEIDQLALKYKLKTDFEKHSVFYVVNILKQYNDLNFKFYRTTNGWRLIETTKTHNSKSDEVWNLMNQLCVDKTYMLFCLRQNCFRARLTPKPWRIGIKRLDIQYPPKNNEENLKYLDWVNKYNDKKNNFSSTKLKFEIGSGIVNPDFIDIIKTHDNYHIGKSDKLK